MQNPTNLAVHEALFYGGSTQRVAWVYGTLGGGAESTLKLGDKVVTLRPQISGEGLGLPGTLSVDGRAAYSGSTKPLGSQVNVTRSGAQYSISALANVDGVYASDGAAWFKLSGPITAGQTVLATAAPSSSLRGAGDLTDAEADALGTQLRGQGVLAVAVLPDSALPDQPLNVEPVLDASRHPLTGLYIQTGIAEAPSTAPSSTRPQSGPSAARQIATGSNAAAEQFQVVVARTSSAAASLWRTAYGRQTSSPAAPSLVGGNSLVGVFLGQRSTGGYSVSLVSARIVGGTLQLTVNVGAPKPGSITTQALTSPWLVAEVSGAYSTVVVSDAAGKTLN